MMTILTIGHSTHSSERFLALLSMHSITAIADVRSSPYSRMNPQFNRETLRTAIKARGVAYAFLGHELGARVDDPDCYIAGKVQYERVAGRSEFQGGLDRVERGAKEHRVAILCAEKDPLTCHRAILVCRHLVDRSLDVTHILEDGRLETHEQAMSRLIEELGMAERDLFRSRDDLFAEAYARRGQEIAYTIKSESAATTHGAG